MGNRLRAFDPDGNQQEQHEIKRCLLATAAHTPHPKWAHTGLDSVISTRDHSSLQTDILKGPLLTSGAASAQGNRPGCVWGAAGSWRAPEGFLIVNFYSRASSFTAALLNKPRVSYNSWSVCFLPGVVAGVAAGPYRDYEGDRWERLCSGHFPHINGRTACSELFLVTQPFPNH